MTKKVSRQPVEADAIAVVIDVCKQAGRDLGVPASTVFRRAMAAIEATRGGQARLEMLLDLLASAVELHVHARELRKLRVARLDAIATEIEQRARASFFERLAADGLTVDDPEEAVAAFDACVRARVVHPRGGNGRSWTGPFAELWRQIRPERRLAYEDSALRVFEQRRRRTLLR